MAHRMSRILVCVAAALFASAAQGAPFADPTRPPDAGSPAPSGASAGPRLESVLIAPDRRLAVISGKQVRLGGKYGEGQVVRITESEVVIRNGEGTETLKLFPEAEKRPRAQRDKRAPR
jgi:MSHA biogenesis protein MshK